jgi:hypothetical protein
MALKRRGREPTYSAVVSQCPVAVNNLDTGYAVDPRAVYKAIRRTVSTKTPSTHGATSNESLRRG